MKITESNAISFGILSMLTSAFCFAFMNAIVKILSTQISPAQTMFFRSVLMAMFIASLFLYKPLNRTNKAGGWLTLFLRSFFGGVSMITLFYNISQISLGIASAFAQSVPIYAVIFASIFLKERQSLGVIIATIIGFVGVILMSDLRGDVGAINIILGIVSGLTAAIALVSVRGCREYFDDRVIILVFALTSTAMASVLLFFGGNIIDNEWINPTPTGWLYVLALGIFGTIAQYFLTQAYILAPAGIVSPIDYTRIVFSLLLGIALGDLLPSTQSLFGMSLIIASGVLIAMPIFLKDIKALKRKRKNEKSI